MIELHLMYDDAKALSPCSAPPPRDHIMSYFVELPKHMVFC